MLERLPVLVYEDLRPTRDYLQDVAKVMGKLQQAYLPKSPHDWQYGLEVTMRGISTQTFKVDGQSTRALLDLVRHKLRLGDQNWPLRENPPAKLFEDIQALMGIKLVEPDFVPDVREYDPEQADKYAAAVWWMERQFDQLKENLKTGVTSPILLYPHHFDLSLVWFPDDDERQLAVGWSTGDETIIEPYVYLTAYPEPAGFSGAVLPYAKLQASKDPEGLFGEFTRAAFGGRSHPRSRGR